MCLDVPGGSTQSYVPLQLFHCHGSDSQGAVQRWQFVPEVTASDGTTAYAIVNSSNNLCLTWVLAFKGISSNIVQLPCQASGSASTLWIVKQSTGNPDDFELGLVFAANGSISPAFNGCLAARDTSDANGTLFGLHTCAAFDDVTQLFRLG
jgi:Ricin-type beta-trefoil lectin domain